MKRYMMRVWVFIFISVGVFLAEAVPQEKLSDPCSLEVMEMSLSTALDICSQSLPVDVDPDLLASLNDGDATVTVSIPNLEGRYVLAWLVHFADAHATVREDGRVYVAADKKLRANDPTFDCYKETEGPWLDPLEKALKIKVNIDLKDSGAGMVLRLMASQMGVSMIIDPAVLRTGDLNEKCTLSTEEGATAKDALAAVLGQAGLTYVLQGGVIYISK
jgi:hypothetical protein